MQKPKSYRVELGTTEAEVASHTLTLIAVDGDCRVYSDLGLADLAATYEARLADAQAAEAAEVANDLRSDLRQVGRLADTLVTLRDCEYAAGSAGPAAIAEALRQAHEAITAALEVLPPAIATARVSVVF